MTVSVVAASGVQFYAKSGGNGGVGGAAALSAPSARAAGNLLIGVIGSSKQYSSVSTGWTQIASIGSGSTWLAAFLRVADNTSNDNLTVTLSASGSYAMGMSAFASSTWGFDPTTCIASHSENVTTAAAGTYALTTGLTGVTAGQMSTVFGGVHGTTDYNNNTEDVSGAAWTQLVQGGVPGSNIFGPASAGGCMVATNVITPTPAVPSQTDSRSTDTFAKFMFAAVITEQAAPTGMAGGGIFWGM